jgi:hypothetical protein
MIYFNAKNEAKIKFYSFYLMYQKQHLHVEAELN